MGLRSGEWGWNRGRGSPPGRKDPGGDRGAPKACGVGGGESLGWSCVQQTQPPCPGLQVGQVWAGPHHGSLKSPVNGSSQGLKSQSNWV